jgi:hypothetical protein
LIPSTDGDPDSDPDADQTDRLTMNMGVTRNGSRRQSSCSVPEISTDM